MCVSRSIRVAMTLTTRSSSGAHCGRMLGVDPSARLVSRVQGARGVMRWTSLRDGRGGSGRRWASPYKVHTRLRVVLCCVWFTIFADACTHRLAPGRFLAGVGHGSSWELLGGGLCREVPFVIGAAPTTFSGTSPKTSGSIGSGLGPL